MDNKNSAKFAFMYMLSLVALVFVAISVGIVLFQIINKNIVDVIAEYSGRFSSESLKFAISALIIASPIYFLIMWLLEKSFRKKELSADSGVRRWLIYFILLVSAVVMIGWLIGTVNSFLNGELTTKFILKFLSSVGISALIFSYYLYDIRRKQAPETKDRTVTVFFYAALAVVLAAFLLAAFNVESPAQTKNRKIDEAVLSHFSNIRYAINNYYQNNDSRLPENLSQLSRANWPSLDAERDFKNPATKEEYEYRTIDEDEYELCAVFLTSNQGGDRSYYPYQDEFPHEAGRQCFKIQAQTDNLKEPLRPIPIM